LKKLSLSEPIVLRNAYVSDIRNHAPLTQASVISTSNLSPGFFSVKSHPSTVAANEITREMRQGTVPVDMLKRVMEHRRARQENSSSVAAENLVLVHGYCAQDQPWGSAINEFTNYFTFSDYGQNKLIDSFAKTVLTQVEHIPQYSIVSHSQGGLVGLHIRNFYWAGLDFLETPGNILTSIGTPYKGVSGAASAADFIKLFGIGCGANTDLTVDGISLWRTGITTEAEADVHYYLTQYKKSGLIKYCNLASNMVLKWPNDGVVEVVNGNLPSGHSEGVTDGECHSVNMKWPPQCQNKQRLAEINSRTAR